MLSIRRLVALQLAAQGDGPEQIAHKLRISVLYASALLSEATAALEADDLRQAVKIARQHGLFEPGGFAIALLTARQKHALLFAAKGLSNKMIAKEMGVAQSTVGSLLVKACKTLGAHNRTHAVSIAIRLRIIPAEEIALPAVLTATYPTLPERNEKDDHE